MSKKKKCKKCKCWYDDLGCLTLIGFLAVIKYVIEVILEL